MINVSQQIKKYGYYTVGSSVYLNKPQAVIASKATNQKINFYYNDEIFNKYNWTQEPEPSVGLREFYKRRAQQIRNDYDYVILLYSGGPDSTNVLTTFVDNEIFIDEIINMNSYQQTGIVNNTIHNADYVHNVEPYLKQLITEKNLKSRITILDEIDLVKQHWNYHTKTDNWESLFGAVVAPSMFITKQVWVRYVPHIWRMILDGKKIGIVIGADKTHLKIINGKYATNFWDILSTDASLLNSEDDDLKHLNMLEMFYHSPDCVDLIIKQAHTLKNLVESIRDPNLFITQEEIQLLETKNQRQAHYCQSKHCHGHLRYNLYHQTIYPGWTANIVTPKTSQLLTRPEDNWWVNDLEYKDKKIFLYGLARINQTPELGIGKGSSRGLSTIFTQPYYLET